MPLNTSLWWRTFVFGYVSTVADPQGGLQPPLRAATSIGTRGARGGESEGRRRRRGRRRLQPPYGYDLDPPLLTTYDKLIVSMFNYFCGCYKTNPRKECQKTCIKNKEGRKRGRASKVIYLYLIWSANI